MAGTCKEITVSDFLHPAFWTPISDFNAKYGNFSNIKDAGFTSAADVLLYPDSLFNRVQGFNTRADQLLSAAIWDCRVPYPVVVNELAYTVKNHPRVVLGLHTIKTAYDIALSATPAELADCHHLFIQATNALNGINDRSTEPTNDLKIVGQFLAAAKALKERTPSPEFLNTGILALAASTPNGRNAFMLTAIKRYLAHS